MKKHHVNRYHHYVGVFYKKIGDLLKPYTNNGLMCDIAMWAYERSFKHLAKQCNILVKEIRRVINN